MGSSGLKSPTVEESAVRPFGEEKKAKTSKLHGKGNHMRLWGKRQQKNEKKNQKILCGAKAPVGTHLEEEERCEWELTKRVIPICLSSGIEKKSMIYS